MNRASKPRRHFIPAAASAQIPGTVSRSVTACGLWAGHPGIRETAATDAAETTCPNCRARLAAN
jgi:hypothetical protein